MSARLQSYLFGSWVSGGDTGAVLRNPATEEELATASTQGVDFGRALRFAREKGGPALRALSFRERGALLEKITEVLQAHREPLLDSAMENGGGTRGDAKFDVDGAIGTLSAYAALGKTLPDTKILADGEGLQLGRGPKFWGQHVHLPKTGVAVLINAFNFPAWGFAEKAACALLAGMPVITKPATATALTAHQITKLLIDKQILPEGSLGFIAGGPGDLVEHLEGQDVLAFTGSASTALELRANPRLLQRNVPINVEADSLNAAVLGPDAEQGSDLFQLFVRDVARDMTQKTGQKCTAIRRIFVPTDRMDEVVEALSAELAEVVIGNPAHPDVRMGPLATARQLSDTKSGTERLLAEADPVFGDPKAKIAGRGSPEGKGYFHPILLLRAKKGALGNAIHQHEVFGPVATLLPYSGSVEEVLRAVQLGGGGLVSSVFSDDRVFVEAMTMGLAPYHGRLYLGCAKLLDQTIGPGAVLPSCVHGGPGRAGGGEELGGLRGVLHYMQRTVIQGYRPIVEKLAAG